MPLATCSHVSTIEARKSISPQRTDRESRGRILNYLVHLEVAESYHTVSHRHFSYFSIETCLCLYRGIIVVHSASCSLYIAVRISITYVQIYRTDVHMTCILITGHNISQPIWANCRLMDSHVHALRVPEDVVAIKSTDNAGEYAVLRKCPAESAARLRVLEKHLVVDHALFLAQRFGRGSCLGNPELAKFVYNLQKCGRTIITEIGQVPTYDK